MVRQNEKREVESVTKKTANLLQGNVMTILLRLAAPLMATAFAQMAYNLVDIFWIGRLSVEAVAACGTVGYFWWIGEAVVQATRVGVSVKSSQAYGAKEMQKSQKVIASGAQLTIILAVVYGAILLIFQDPLIRLFHLSNDVNEMAKQYLQIIALGMPIIFIVPTLSSAYHSTGDSATPFKLNVIGLVTNIVIDPVFIFTFRLGVRGAALASVTANLVTVVLFFFHMKHYHPHLSKVPWFNRPNFTVYGDMLRLGIPSGAQNGLHALISMYLTRLIGQFGPVPVAVYSAGSQMESLTWLSAEGIAFGLTVMVGQHVGAKATDRLKEVIHKGLFLTLLSGLVGTAVLILGRHSIFPFFIKDSEEALRLGAMYLLILGVSQCFQGMEIGATGVFHGLGQTKIPSVVGMTLNLLRIPMALFLMPYYGAPGVWAGISISSILKGSVDYFLLRRYLNQEII